MTRRLKLGVIANEFFDPSLGRMGGFGWAARQLNEIFGADPALGVDLTYLSGELAATRERGELQAHGARLILRQRSRWRNARTVRREGFDLLLTIDYDLAHSVYLRALPRTPAIIWVRDPRTPADIAEIATLRIPGAEGETPQGLGGSDGTSLGRIAREAAWCGRKLLFATPAPHLVARLEPTYGVDPWEVFCLPNPILLDPPACVESERPSIVFLGRLDPIKRPWLFAELARRFPEADFLFLGQAHAVGPGAWQPRDLAPNVRLMGHVDGAEKLRILSAAWVVANTSIHEGLAISFLEALACETPILACQNPGFAVSRYGIYAGRFEGSGMDGLDALGAGLKTLLDNRELRLSLGRAGREWVRATHSRARFLEAFRALCARAGLAQ